MTSSNREPLVPETDPQTMIRPRRRITGMAAVLLPFDNLGRVDWRGFTELASRIVKAGLVPAVNMDTGYADLIDEPTRADVLRRTRGLAGTGGFVAGAFVRDRPGDLFQLDAYISGCEPIVAAGGVPVIFPSHGLAGLAEDRIVEAYAQIGRQIGKFIAFELGAMFAPFGRIFTLETYEGLLNIPQCIGAKHSSLSREMEWKRLQLRDAVRPEFQVLTGNDLAIDMVMYGSDYLLGLAAFAPDAFALRDRLWAEGDPAFYEVNDLLQCLGQFAFREPVPAYKHSAAQFLKLRGWIEHDAPHPAAARRAESDKTVLELISERLSDLLSRSQTGKSG